MGFLFGALLRFIGFIIMVGATLWGCLLVIVMLDPTTNIHSHAGKAVLFALLVGVPYLIGRGISKLGKRLQNPEEPGDFARQELIKRHERKSGWGTPANASRSPAPYKLRPPVQEVDVDHEPDPTPPPLHANPVPGDTVGEPPPVNPFQPMPSKGAAKPDMFSMGTDTLYDPTKGK